MLQDTKKKQKNKNAVQLFFITMLFAHLKLPQHGNEIKPAAQTNRDYIDNVLEKKDPKKYLFKNILKIIQQYFS